MPGLYLRFFRGLCATLAAPLLLLGSFPPRLALPPLPPRVGTVFPRVGVPVEPVLVLPPLDEVAAVRAILISVRGLTDLTQSPASAVLRSAIAADS